MKAPRLGRLVFFFSSFTPVRRWRSSAGSQAWNMLSHTQGVKNDTDHDAR